MPNNIFSRQNNNFTSDSPRPQRDRNVLWALLAAGILIIIIIINIVLANTSSSPTAEDGEDPIINESSFNDNASDSEPYLSIQDAYVTQDTFGNAISNGIAEFLRTTINSTAELATAPNPATGDYTATIDATSLSRSTQPDCVLYFFNITVSDGRTYEATVRRDNDYFPYAYYLVLHRTAPAASDAYLLVAFISPSTISSADGDSYYDRQTVIDQAFAWGQSLSYSNLSATVIDFSE